MKFLLFILALAFASIGAAQSVSDQAVEARIARIAAELRCLVCQNQSIADSNAELAVDLRNQIREQIAAGRSDAQISEFMVERYGDFVLYRPPFKATTALLWTAPALLLLIGVVVLRQQLRSRQKEMIEPVSLSAAEHAQAAQLLEDEKR